MSNNQLLSLLGLCRAAHLCSFGHDAAKASLRARKARLCLLCTDASPRLAREFEFLTGEAKIALRKIPFTSLDIKQATQFKAAVVTIDDKGFADKIAQILT